MPFSINWHRGNQLEAEMADVNTRIFFPKMFRPYERKLERLVKREKIVHLNIIELFLDRNSYIECVKTDVLQIPLNLSNKLYSKIFNTLSFENPLPQYLLVPGRFQLTAAFAKSFNIKYRFAHKCFRIAPASIKMSPFRGCYVLFELKFDASKQNHMDRSVVMDNRCITSEDTLLANGKEIIELCEATVDRTGKADARGVVSLMNGPDFLKTRVTLL